MDQFEQDVLNVFAHVASFGKGGGIGDSEWNVEHFGQRLSQQGLAATRWTHEQDVGLCQFNFAAAGRTVLNPLVVVVDRYREDLLRRVLADDVVVQEFANLTGFEEFVK